MPLCRPKTARLVSAIVLVICALGVAGAAPAADAFPAAPVSPAMPYDPAFPAPRDSGPLSQQLSVVGDPRVAADLSPNGGMALDQSTWPSGVLAITGPLSRRLYLDAGFSQSRDALPSVTGTLRFDGGPLRMQAGDITANLAGGDFLQLNQPARGLQFDARTMRGAVTGIVSEVVAVTQTDTLAGTGTAGPYYLTGAPVAPGSEVASVDGVVLRRGIDYLIDYAGGSITLVGRVLAEGAQALVRYQPMRGRLAPGTLLGLRATLSPTHGLTLGLSHASGLRADAAGASAVDHAVTGLDFDWQDSRGLSFSLQGASSNGPAVPGVGSGALAAAASYAANRASASVRYQTVDAGFSQLDDSTQALPGRSLDWAATLIPLDAVSLFVSGADAVRSTDTRQPAAEGVRSQTIGIDIHPIGLPALVAQRTTQETRQPTGAGGDVTINDSVVASWVRGQFFASANLDRGSLISTPGDAPGGTAMRNTSQAASLNLTQRFGPRLETSLMLGANDQRSETDAGVVATGGRQLLASSTYQWSDRLSTTIHAQGTATYPMQGTEGAGSPAQTGEATGLTTSWRVLHGLDVQAGYATDWARTDAAGGVAGARQGARTLSLSGSFQPDTALSASASVNVRRHGQSADGTTSAGTDTSLLGYATFAPREGVSLSGSVSADTVDAGGAAPVQRSGMAALRGDWQATPTTAIGLSCSGRQYADADYGASGSATLAASATWRPRDAVAFGGYVAGQALRDPLVIGASRSYLAGANVECSPARHLNAALDAQRVWGSSVDGVSRLWQDEGLARRSSAAMADGAGWLPVAGDAVTLLAATARYSPWVGHDALIGGEVALGDGPAGTTRRSALRLGWHYRPDARLSIALDARLAGAVGMQDGLGYAERSLSFEGAWRF